MSSLILNKHVDEAIVEENLSRVASLEQSYLAAVGKTFSRAFPLKYVPGTLLLNANGVQTYLAHTNQTKRDELAVRVACEINFSFSVMGPVYRSVTEKYAELSQRFDLRCNKVARDEVRHEIRRHVKLLSAAGCPSGSLLVMTNLRNLLQMPGFTRVAYWQDQPLNDREVFILATREKTFGEIQHGLPRVGLNDGMHSFELKNKVVNHVHHMIKFEIEPS